ncbi:MAG: glycosyltransferase family 1 protein, partial [Gammaproteobacteria bacterium]
MWDNPRLLFIDHTSALGGSELCLLDIARAWRARGCVVLFEDGPLARRLGEAGVRVEVL